MQRYPLYDDERLGHTCFNCGSAPETRDHVPPRVFLDEPYPDNIMRVPSCTKCNLDSSGDEQYVASLIEVAVCGTTDPSRLQRRKISKTLEHAAPLRARLDQAVTVDNGIYTVLPQLERVNRVLEKIARGLWCFDNSQDTADFKTSVNSGVVPLSEEDSDAFFDASSIQPWGGLTSHGFMRSLFGTEKSTYGPGWVDLQLGRFSYSVDSLDGERVRMIFSDYLHSDVRLDAS